MDATGQMVPRVGIAAAQGGHRGVRPWARPGLCDSGRVAWPESLPGPHLRPRYLRSLQAAGFLELVYGRQRRGTGEQWDSAAAVWVGLVSLCVVRRVPDWRRRLGPGACRCRGRAYDPRQRDL